MTEIDNVFVQIARFVLNQSDFSFSRAQTMIKQHTEKLSQIGDIGFPTTIQPWLNNIENPNGVKNLKQIIESENEEEFARKLIETSATWSFPIREVQFKQFRCLLYLDRPKCLSGILKTVLSDDTSYGQCHRPIDNQQKVIYAVRLAKLANDNSLVEHRCMLIAKVLTNLLRVSGIETLAKTCKNHSDAMNVRGISITYARSDAGRKISRQTNIESNNNNNVQSTLIVCGSVISKSGYSADEYIRLRSLDMEKLAESKHGQNKEKYIIDKCRKLGTAIVTFDLLKTKHFNVIDFEKLMSATSTVKGAAFILYNFARLHTLLAIFEQQVRNGFYQPLPEFEQINFALLKEEEEWQMFYVYIVGFPSMLERCIIGIDNGQIAIHLLCTFLSNLSALFSVYYHRIKILTDNLPQLLPVMHARIYFLKALRTVFLQALSILEIEPLDQM